MNLPDHEFALRVRAMRDGGTNVTLDDVLGAIDANLSRKSDDATGFFIKLEDHANRREHAGI